MSLCRTGSAASSTLMAGCMAVVSGLREPWPSRKRIKVATFPSCSRRSSRICAGAPACKSAVPKCVLGSKESHVTWEKATEPIAKRHLSDRINMKTGEHASKLRKSVQEMTCCTAMPTWYQAIQPSYYRISYLQACCRGLVGWKVAGCSCQALHHLSAPASLGPHAACVGRLGQVMAEPGRKSCDNKAAIMT